MSVQTADSQFSFSLPSMSYIDARWEEPNLRVDAASPVEGRKRGLIAWLSRRLATLRARRIDNAAARELALMSDHELMDIGLTRADVGRAFAPDFNDDLRQRGTYA